MLNKVIEVEDMTQTVGGRTVNAYFGYNLTIFLSCGKAESVEIANMVNELLDPIQAVRSIKLTAA